MAACCGSIDIVERLLAAGADIEAGMNRPLMEAAQEGHVDMVKFLIQKGIVSRLRIWSFL